jgi:hypothetical protein
MRTLSIYTFSELSEEAKKKAIIDVREELKENTPHELVFDWAIDDCWLFEPSEQVMKETFGDQYLEDLGGGLLMENLRIGINNKNGDLNITQALKITNESMFKTWLGIPKIIQNYIKFSVIGTDEDASTLDFEIALPNYDPRGIVLRECAEEAARMFDRHMLHVEGRIINGIREYFSDDNLTETISTDDRYEFLENGTLYNS